jgi:hypothetical protein
MELEKIREKFTKVHFFSLKIYIQMEEKFPNASRHVCVQLADKQIIN